MIYLCSVVSELSKYDIFKSMFFLRIDTGVIFIGNIIQINQCLVLAERKGCRVRYWVVVE